MLPAGTGHPYGGNYAFFAPPEPAEQVKGLPLFARAAYAYGGASRPWEPAAAPRTGLPPEPRLIARGPARATKRARSGSIGVPSRRLVRPLGACSRGNGPPRENGRRDCVPAQPRRCVWGTRAPGGLEMAAPQGYCVKCKTKREMKDAVKIEMKHGRPATEGKCPVCGTKMFKIGAS